MDITMTRKRILAVLAAAALLYALARPFFEAQPPHRDWHAPEFRAWLEARSTGSPPPLNMPRRLTPAQRQALGIGRPLSRRRERDDLTTDSVVEALREERASISQ